MSSGCLNTYKNSIIAEGSRVRLLPPITPTRNSMIAEGFRVWLLPARNPTRNPLDFEGFRVEEMSGKWTADFQHSRLALPHTIDPRTGSVPGQNKRENGRTNKPNPNTKRLPFFNVGGCLATNLILIWRTLSLVVLVENTEILRVPTSFKITL